MKSCKNQLEFNCKLDVFLTCYHWARLAAGAAAIAMLFAVAWMAHGQLPAPLVTSLSVNTNGVIVFPTSVSSFLSSNGIASSVDLTNTYAALTQAATTLISTTSKMAKINGRSTDTSSILMITGLSEFLYGPSRHSADTNQVSYVFAEQPQPQSGFSFTSLWSWKPASTLTTNGWSVLDASSATGYDSSAPGRYVIQSVGGQWATRYFNAGADMVAYDYQGEPTYAGSGTHVATAIVTGGAYAGVWQLAPLGTTNAYNALASTVSSIYGDQYQWNLIKGFTDGTFYSTDFQIPNDGVTDSQPALDAMFSVVSASTAPLRKVVIAPGNYYLGVALKTNNISIPSNIQIDATGAIFRYPTNLNTAASGNTDYPLLKTFIGTDVTNVTWIGGTFNGYGFDLFASDLTTNKWNLTNGVMPLYFTSTAGNGCNGITIRNVNANWLNGPAVGIEGIGSVINGSQNVSTWSGNITIDGCKFNKCSCPLFDYGRMANWVGLYPTNVTDGQYAFATNQIIQRALIGPVVFTSGSALIQFDNSGGKVPIAPDGTDKYAVSFYGTNLTLVPNLFPCSRYYVVASTTTNIQVSRTYGGAAITFTGTATNNMFYGIGADSTFGVDGQYAPTGQPKRTDWSGQSTYDGAWQVSFATNVAILNSTWSSTGDGDELNYCIGVRINNNELTSSVMGALFVGPYCQDVVVNGNVFDSQNGSRVLTVESGSTGVSIAGNVFKNGGRGVLLNGASHATLSGNRFLNNNLKSTPVSGTGHWQFNYGGWNSNAGFNITSGGLSTPVTNIVFSGNTSMATNVAYWYNLAVVNYGTTIVGNTHIARWSFPSPTANTINYRQNAPGFWISVPTFNLTVDNNAGLQTSVDASTTATIYTSTTNFTIPHGLPWQTWYLQTAYQNGVNYYPTVSGNFGGPSVYSATADATNIYVSLTSAPATNTSFTVNYKLNVSPVMPTVTDLDALDLANRIAASGGSLTAAELTALNVMTAGFKTDSNWQHLIGIYPLMGGYNGFNQALKVPQYFPKAADFHDLFPTNITTRGVYFDGVNSLLWTPISPTNITSYGSFSSLQLGGLGVLLNDAGTFPTQSATGSVAIGLYDGVDRDSIQMTTTDGYQYSGYWGLTSGATYNAGANPLATYIHMVRTGATLLTLYSGSGSTTLTSRATYTSSVTAVGSTWRIGIGGRSNTGLTPSNPYKGTIGFAVITDGAETPSTVWSRIYTFCTAIGRLP